MRRSWKGFLRDQGLRIRLECALLSCSFVDYSSLSLMMWRVPFAIQGVV